MPTKFYRFKGKVNWARVKEGQKDTKFDPGGVYNIDFYPNNVSRFIETGIQTQSREDEDGVFFKVKRYHEQFLNKESVIFGPPKITLNNGTGNVPFDGNIGNGSVVILDIAIFDTRKGKGHRVESLEILELVEYDGKEVIDADLPEVPEATAKAKSKVKSKSFETKLDDLDDDIPF